MLRCNVTNNSRNVTKKFFLWKRTRCWRHPRCRRRCKKQWIGWVFLSNQNKSRDNFPKALETRYRLSKIRSNLNQQFSNGARPHDNDVELYNKSKTTATTKPNYISLAHPSVCWCSVTRVQLVHIHTKYPPCRMREELQRCRSNVTDMTTEWRG